VDVAGERLAHVGLAVPIRVFEDQQFVIHRFGGLPVRIGRPGGDPQAAPRVERHLHRIGQFGELLFRCEQRDFHLLVDGHLADCLFAPQKNVLAAFQRSRLLEITGKKGGRLSSFTAMSFPFAAAQTRRFAIAREEIQHFELALDGAVIRTAFSITARALRELEKGAVAVG